MKNQAGSRMLLILTSALVCVIAGLLAFLYFDFRAERMAADSRRMLSETELYRAAENLAEDLQDGMGILAYHDAKEAAESAREMGQEKTAMFFDRIARKLIDQPEQAEQPEQPDGMEAASEEVRRFLETGDPSGEEIAAAAFSEESGDADEPMILSKIRLERARLCADRIIGAGKVLHLCGKSRAGRLIFTCANGCAVIDEATGLPVEASLSLAPGTPRLTTEECAAQAQAFLTSIYPKDIAAAAVMCGIEPAEGGQIMRAHFYSLGRRITLDVRRDSGRIVGLWT